MLCQCIKEESENRPADWKQRTPLAKLQTKSSKQPLQSNRRRLNKIKEATNEHSRAQTQETPTGSSQRGRTEDLGASFRNWMQRKTAESTGIGTQATPGKLGASSSPSRTLLRPEGNRTKATSQGGEQGERHRAL
jgi:hypothetical protein